MSARAISFDHGDAPCAGEIKNNEAPQAQRKRRIDCEVPPAQRKKKIDEASAMLLYEAPSGIAIFSFNGAYLENPVKSLEFFLKYERVSTPFDLDNGTIDNFLAKRLTKLCGPKKKLAVGGAEHNKGIIEVKLGITCLYVGAPDCEVISCSLKNPDHTLLPEEKSETYKRNCLPSGNELVKFLHRHYFDVKPEMVHKFIVELTGLLPDIELREMEHLKFLRILLKDFLIVSGIGNNWSLIELATLLEMICYREASYEGLDPNEIFSHDEYQKIEVNASRYKTSFSRIDVLSVYEDVVSLDTAKDILLFNLDCLANEAREVSEKAEVIILPTGSKVGKEGSTNVDDRLNPIPEGNCSEVTLVNGKLDSSETPQQDVKQILTISDEHPSMKKSNSNEEICKEDDHCLIPDKVEKKLAANMDGVERNMQSRGTEGIPDTSMSSKSEPNKLKDVISATSKIPKSDSGTLKYLNGDRKKSTASTPGWLGMKDDQTATSNSVGDDKENKLARDNTQKTLTPVLLGDKNNAEFNARSSRFSSVLKEQNKVIPATSSQRNEEKPATSEITAASTPAGVQSTAGDKMYPASSDIPNSGQLKHFLMAERERDKKEYGSKYWSLSFKWPVSNSDASLVRSQSSNADLNAPAKMSHRNVGRRSGAMKQACMPFVCFYPVR